MSDLTSAEQQGATEIDGDLDDLAKFETIKAWFRADASHSSKWRSLALEWFGFLAGEQWSPEDLAKLEAKGRPAIVFNRVLTVLKAVAGMEINGRHEIHFIPRNTEDTAVNEVLSGACKWMADGCDGEDEESQAFQNALAVGMGWCENRLDYEEDASGRYVEESIDPLEMYWDRTARKKNLTDARRLHRLRKMPLGDAMQLFPGKLRHQLDAAWAVGLEFEDSRKSQEQSRRREQNESAPGYDDNCEVTIVNTQWWERECYYLVADPQTNSRSELSEEQHTTLSARAAQIGKPFDSVKMTRRVYKEAFLGGELLSIGPAPIPGRFKWAVITGELDRTKGTWFGLVAVMHDPQMWANKWLSQSLHILNTTAKGGIVAELDAFDDQREAEETWAKPDEITWVKRGSLSGPTGAKIMPKPGGAFPQGHIELMQFAISAIRDVSGINLELLGLKDVNQPGVLEAQRKQAGMTVLATMFDSLRRFRKITGRVRLHLVQNFFSDGRIIRIVGPDGAKAVPILRDKTVGDYDVIVDDAPTSPNQKEANWGIISMMLPMFREQLAQHPEVLALVLEHSPLPMKLVDAIKGMIANAAPDQERQKQIGRQHEQLDLAAKVANINKDQGAAEQSYAKAGGAQATALYDIAMSQRMLTNADADAKNTEARTAGEIAYTEHTKAKAKAMAELAAATAPEPQQSLPQ